MSHISVSHISVSLIEFNLVVGYACAGIVVRIIGLRMVQDTNNHKLALSTEAQSSQLTMHGHA